MSTLFVASTGGHLAQLHELADRIDDGRRGDRLWVTFDSEQGRTLLDGEDRLFIPYIAERDVAGVGRAMWYAKRIIGKRKTITRVVSTGSGIALSFLPYAALRGIEAHYIESAARVGQPSLTGRLLQSVPGIRLYRQYPHVSHGNWRFGGSVFDGFESVSVEPRPLRRVVVTLGMERGFRRLLERAAAILPSEIDVLWQTGPTPVDGLDLAARPFVAAQALDKAMHEADVVVAHAGCGSALAALKAGKFPILVPRDPRHNEVVDMHQIEIARWLSRQGLALERAPEELSLADFETAARRAVIRTVELPPFRLAKAA
ncbi:glycosyltransferase [Benzoatithermus flavus]|uniref:Glycosyltransferase n=1 Tax=Benzoatithermus flavus TaxID=3108223 RepID=A0ABU8XL12_9PROT